MEERRRKLNQQNPAEVATPQKPTDKDQMTNPITIFPQWELIYSVVLQEFIAKKQKLQNDGATADELAVLSGVGQFSEMVSRLVNNHPNWGVRPVDVPRLTTLIREAFFGLGQLTTYMALPNLEEIICNRFDEMFIVQNGKKTRVQSPFNSEKELTEYLARLFMPMGRELNRSNPAEDGSLPDGSRIHADIPPVAHRGACFAIRKFNPQPFTMDDYLKTDMFSQEFLTDLQYWMDHHMNIVVAGGTASGKTTFLNAIGKALLPREDRLIIIEDNKELQIETEDYVYLQAAQKGARARSGQGDSTSITIRDCLRYSLRLRPDRIIIGELRAHEAYDLLQALNTGHDGSMTTIHANSSRDAISRLASLAVAAGELPIDSIYDLIARTINIVLHVSRFRGTPFRKVMEAWQFFHEDEVAEEAQEYYERLKAAGEVRQIRDTLMGIALYSRGGDGVMTKRNPVLPTVAKFSLRKDYSLQQAALQESNLSNSMQQAASSNGHAAQSFDAPPAFGTPPTFGNQPPLAPPGDLPPWEQ